MHSILTTNRHYSLFHFTDSRNIESIRKHKALLSYRELVRLGIGNIAFGGNDWSHEADKMSHVDDYVHLCFLQNHPMEYRAREDGRINTTLWLQINIDVLHIDGVRFTSDVSNKTGVHLLANDDAKNEFDLEAIFKFLDFSIPGNQDRKSIAEKYEVLIPKKVPLRLIRNI